MGLRCRNALTRCFAIIVATMASLLFAVQALQAQGAGASLQCFEVPPSLLRALRQYQGLVGGNLDVRDARSEIAQLMIRPQSPSENRHNVVSNVFATRQSFVVRGSNVYVAVSG